MTKSHDHNHHTHRTHAVHRAHESTPLLKKKGPVHGCGHVGAQHEETAKARRRLLLAAFFCLLFMCAEVVGGIIANSLAVLTDAVHLLSDIIGFVVSIVALYISTRPATDRMSFGFYRAEIMGAVFSVFMIWALTVFLIYEAIQRLLAGTTKVNGPIMFITASLGVVVNIVMGCILGHGGHSHSHSHSQAKNLISHTTSETEELFWRNKSPTAHSDGESDEEHGHHGHEHQHEEVSAKQHKKDLNVRAAMIHVLGDLLQSLGVMLAGALIWWRPSLWWTDPLCTLLFSVIVMFTTTPIIKESILVLMEGTPTTVNVPEVGDDLMQIDGVEEVHDLHIWMLTPSRIALAVHLRVASGTQANHLLASARAILKSKHNIDHTTIQLDEVNQACSQSNRSH